jgi:RNA polymerase sigma-70 factor (family 1)
VTAKENPSGWWFFLLTSHEKITRLLNLNNHTSDHDLMENLQKGDPEAFDLIFKRYGDRLYGFAFKYLKSREEAEELVQDVFLKIWENRKNLKQEGTLRSYLFTISYHNMCRLFRRRNYQEKLARELVHSGEETISIDEKIDYRSVMEQVDQLIEQLPARQKEIFILSRKEGKSSKEIAEELKIVPGTVDNHISEALKFIRKQLGKSLGLMLYFSVFIHS